MNDRRQDHGSMIRTRRLLALVAVCLGGCMATHALNARNAERYYETARRYESAGDWTLARISYGRACANVTLGKLGPAAEARCLYEWSRITGYLGETAAAEDGFRRVLTLIDAAAGEVDYLRPPSLCELARLLYDTERYEEANPVYESAVNELEKTPVENEDPIAFADFLDEYAQSLRAAAFDSRASAVAERATALRRKNPGQKPKFVPQRYRASGFVPATE
jgi:tetratricopeptide (TPR) repeat protein